MARSPDRPSFGRRRRPWRPLPRPTGRHPRLAFWLLLFAMAAFAGAGYGFVQHANSTVPQSVSMQP